MSHYKTHKHIVSFCHATRISSTIYQMKANFHPFIIDHRAIHFPWCNFILSRTRARISIFQCLCGVRVSSIIKLSSRKIYLTASVAWNYTLESCQRIGGLCRVHSVFKDFLDRFVLLSLVLVKGFVKLWEGSWSVKRIPTIRLVDS